MRITWLQHVPFEGLAAIAPWAAERGHDVTRVRVFAGEPLPGLETFDWLVIMGGEMGVHDDADHPWLAAERGFVREAIDAGKLVLGVCLGAQFVADALGGRVYRNPAGREIGWWELRPTPEAAGSVTFADVSDSFLTLHWHGDTFELPAAGVLLAESDATPVQAFEALGGRVVALQFHPEMTSAGLEGILAGAADELDGSDFVQSAEELRAGIAEHEALNAAVLAGILSRMEGLHAGA